MTRFPAPLMLLVLLPAVGRADGAAPFPSLPSRSVRVPVVVTLTSDQEHPDHEFYLPIREGMEHRRERFSLFPAAGPRRVAPKIGQPVTLYAVPKRLTGPGEPEPAWGEPPPGAEVVGTLDLRDYDLAFWDDRKVVEWTYRIDHGPDGWRLVSAGGNDPDPRIKWAWTGGICCFLPVGVVGLGLWAVRRLRRRAAASAPPSAPATGSVIMTGWGTGSKIG